MSKNKPIKTNRVKLLEVSAQVIAEICKKAVQNKLPDDAAVLRISYNPNSNNLDVIVCSEEFPEIPEGSMVPKVDKLPVISDDILK